MKTTVKHRVENYVSPEVEIIDITIQSGILDGSGSGEQIDDCKEESISYDCPSNS